MLWAEAPRMRRFGLFYSILPCFGLMSRFGVRRLDAALPRRGLTRHQPLQSIISSPRVVFKRTKSKSIRSRCRATANESGVKPPHSKRDSASGQSAYLCSHFAF